MIDLNRIAQEASKLTDGQADYFWLAEQVPALVAEVKRQREAVAAEREVCAQLCDKRATAWHYSITSLPHNADPGHRQELRGKELEATYLAELIRSGVSL